MSAAEIDCPNCGHGFELSIAAMGIPDRPRVNAVLTADLLDAIRRSAGRWVLVRTYRGASRRVAVKTPADVETMCKYPTRGGKRTELYARLRGAPA